MPALRTIVARLFTLPGGPASESQLVVRAGRAHQHVFQRECQDNAALCAALPCLSARLRSCDTHRERNRLCCHPAFVEGLHRLSPVCPRLKAWHDAVASPSALDVADQTGDDFGPLGNIEFALRMHDCCQWHCPLRMTSDMFGRLHFPGSDWGLALQTSAAGCDCVLANENIDVTSDENLLRWQWAGDERPFLVMPRDAFRRMIVANPARMKIPGDCHGAGTRVMPSIKRGSPLCETGVRYKRIHIPDDAHASQTATIVGILHEAMKCNSPVMHHEFCTYMSAINGFELALTTPGTVQSFSDPSLPGVMSLNVSYNGRHEPQLSPLSFTWLAHELAHTKFYLINDIAYDHGWTFVRNGAEMTDEVQRYGRPLPIRTLFQIPYTHLYEWVSLMDFLDADFTGLPWSIAENPIAYGDDVKSEIEEALSLTDEVADLTPLGTEAFSRFAELYGQSLTRWRAMTAA